MIEPVRLDVTLVRREDVRLTFTFRTEGRPVDITGWEAKAAIATAPGVAPLLEIGMAANVNGSRFEIMDAEAGVLELFIAEEDNTALPTSGGATATHRFAYDILITGAEDTNRYFYGEYVVEPGVTV